MISRRAKSSGTSHRFGGDWTTAKLQVLAEYLCVYTTALKNQPFRKAYIDAFAGTGYREVRQDSEENSSSTQSLLFPDLAEPEPQTLLDGSARLALQTTSRFDKYIFIERSPQRCAQLEILKGEFPELADDIDIQQGEANERIQDICQADWISHRAVLFLDPYGMQVEWKSIEAIAGTRGMGD